MSFLHCISSMKTMKGCDFCSKDRSGGFVVFCCLQICYLKHKIICLILSMVLLQGVFSVSDFLIKPQKNQYVAAAWQKTESLRQLITCHKLWGRYSFWNMPLLGLLHVSARDSFYLCKRLQKWRRGSTVWSVLTLQDRNSVQSA